MKNALIFFIFVRMRAALCGCALLLIALPIRADISPPYAQKKQLYEEIYLRDQPRDFLLCYPRSGSTWLRYCLEWITQRPSLTPNMHGPIGWIAEFPIDINKAPIYRAHNKHQMNLRVGSVMTIQANPAIDKLVFLLRNPHETIARNNEWHSLLKKNDSHGYLVRSYFENIEFFETWPSDMRLLIHYEDLITAPRETLTRILTFLEEPLTRLDQFMQEYEQHKKKSIALYVGIVSKGEDVLFHSKKIAPENLAALDAWIETNYPHIWNTYLKSRYAIIS